MDQDFVPLHTKFETNHDEILSRETSPPSSVPKRMSEIKASVAPCSVVLKVGPKSSLVDCPYCHACVKTTVKYTTTTRTHMLALFMCFITCCLSCCCPFCCSSTRNSDHYCPNCTRYLGTYKK